MSELQQILNERREKLVEDIIALSEQKNNALECINYCYIFIEENIVRTEKDAKTVPKGFLKNMKNSGKRSFIEWSSDEMKQFDKISMQSRAYEASILIDEEFGKLNKPNYLMDEFGERIKDYDQVLIQNEANLKLLTFIYHQFFITMISTLDDYFSQLLLLILQAYQEKLGNKKIFQVNFNDVNNLLEAGRDEFIIKSIDEQIVFHVRNMMGQKPYTYLTDLVDYLGDSKLIRLERLTYSEMCLRRNVGVHCGWFGNQDYNIKIKELMKGDTGNELNFSFNETNFLGFDTEYFDQSYDTSKKIITELTTYCETKFTQQDSN
ncbi:MAG: hypothetical protein ACK5OU_01390 [Dolichospermum sp.]